MWLINTTVGSPTPRGASASFDGVDARATWNRRSGVQYSWIVLLVVAFAVTVEVPGAPMLAAGAGGTDRVVDVPRPRLTSAPALERLCVTGPSMRVHRFLVERADTERKRGRGLMYRRTLAPDRGMIFLYPAPREITMWMKNTFISLDMLFFDAKGKIIRIEPRTEPHSTAIIRSGGLALGVVEFKGGVSESLGIRVGDRILHPRFDRACPDDTS